ncbi:MAG: hypothetical protein ABR928_12025 [Terracidiphilus sp.]|jgi:6-phosphogluconolactonase (cycloisomerase 2 family)
MKVARLARVLPALLLVVAPFMDGCGDFWQAPGGSGGSGTTSTTLSSGVFYLLNQAPNEIIAYSITTGSLNTIGNYTLASAPTAIAIAPGSGYLYVATAGAGVYIYTISSTGALTVGNNGQAIIPTDLAQAITVDTTGKWLVDAEDALSGAVYLNAYQIDTSTGLLTTGTQYQQTVSNATASVEKMAIGGDDGYIFVALGEDGTWFLPFSSGSTNPITSSGLIIPTKTSGASALSVAVDPVPTGATTPRLFYVGETDASSGYGGLRAFDYSTLGSGSVTEISGSPYSAGGASALAPAAILPDASGDYIYVASGNGTSDGLIQGFNITSSGTGSSTTYSLSAINTVATGITPAGMAEDSQNNFVFTVSSGGSPALSAFIFDTTTLGQLDTTNISVSGTGAVAVAAQAP